MVETSAKANKKRHREENDGSKDEQQQDPESEQQQDPEPPMVLIKPKKKEFHNKEIPGSSHYQVSWMHAKTVIAAVTSTKHGYVITASHDGTVKFWKRLSVDTNDGDGNGGGDQQQQQQQLHQQPCLEFVKSFTAHSAGTVQALSMDETGDSCVSVGSADC
jgi:peptidylprolyl isomerase domain and WD repeat-containing protein 1